ncbi:uncharacterized protein [Clytia hemisphaerica]|uniref:Uncharacterized protein n=1 Tax=Clytia hemisphaerica TaxID=252671 RepID=A0A7M5U3N4_9CNID
MNSSYKLLVSTICILVLGLAGLIVGMLADHWFHIEMPGAYTSNFGMLRLCIRKWSFDNRYETTCSQRPIQTFSDNTVWQLPIEGAVFDEILTLLMTSTLIGGVAFAFFAFMGLTMEKKRFRWRLTGVFGFFLTLTAAIIAITACAISEGYIQNELLHRDYNVTEQWTSTVCWCGAALLIIACLASLFVIYKAPDDDSNKDYSNTGNTEPVYTVQANILHTNENLYMDAVTALPDTVALSLDFFNIANELPPPPSYAEARRDQGTPPSYIEIVGISNPYTSL